MSRARVRKKRAVRWLRENGFEVQKEGRHIAPGWMFQCIVGYRVQKMWEAARNRIELDYFWGPPPHES